MVVEKGLVNHEGKIGVNGFLYMMRESVRRYNMCRLDLAMKDSQTSDGWNPVSIRSVVMGIKGLLVEEDAAHQVSKLNRIPN